MPVICYIWRKIQIFYHSDKSATLKTKHLNIKLVGEVTYGNGLGRTFGFPTANLLSSEQTEGVECGVYAAQATVDGERHLAVVNIGRSPSVVENGVVRVEAHLLDFDGDLYGHTIEVELLHFIRSERKFASQEALREQIRHDCATARDLLTEHGE